MKLPTRKKTQPIPDPPPAEEPEPDKGIGQAAGQYLTGVCATCDKVFAAFVTWFGDPVYEPYLNVIHLNEAGNHAPEVVSTGVKFQRYEQLRATGWKPLSER